MARISAVACPLCSNKVRLEHLAPGGICYYCSDARRDDLRENSKKSEELFLKKEEIAEEVYIRFNNQKDARIKDKEEEAKEQKREEERRKLQVIHKEQASKELARQSLLHYIERKNSKYDASWAHELVASQIEEFFYAVERKESPRMIIALQARFGKSELASISGPAWAFGHWPQWKFVIASYSDSLPTDFSKDIREQLRSPDYQTLFPHGARLNLEDASAQAWSTIQGGGLRATGVGGGLLGFGCDCLIIDDPVKSVEEANSPAALDKLWQWYSSVAYSRLLPGGGVLIIQQRMAVDDLVGRLLVQQREEESRLAGLHREIETLEKSELDSTTTRELGILKLEAEELDLSMDRWRYLEYPALATQDEYYDKSVGEIKRLPSGMEPDPTWKELRKCGEALHEKRYSRSYLLKLKRSNPRMFSCMYMLAPILEEGAYFNINDFKRYRKGHHPKLELTHIYAAWDLAIGTRQSNDYTVGVAGCLDSEGNLWLLDMIRGKFGDIREVADHVIDLHTKWKASVTGIERTHIEMALGPILKSRMRERNTYIVVTEGKEKLVPVADKTVRARSLQGLCRGGKFFVPEGEEYDNYISELTRFGAGGHDDQVDATAWLAILALKNAPPRNPKVEGTGKKFKSWMDELWESMSTKSGTYMES